jgi:dTDP-4-dehydrorhamnose reductase
MLGSMVWHYLQQTTSYKVWGSVRAAEQERVARQPHFIEFDATDSDTALARAIAKIRPHWIINCIGIIKPYCKDDDPVGIRNAIVVNALFPYRLVGLAQKLDARVIQIATDCVYSGRQGKYDELAPHDPLDAYGKTKSLGEVKADNMLHIRCSIIGPELEVRQNPSLLEWFLRQPAGSHIPGFTHHQWNGVTTLQFAQLCQDIMAAGENFFDTLVRTSPIHHFIPNETVNKYELLALCAKAFSKPVTIKRVDGGGPAVDRSLATRFTTLAPLARQPRPWRGQRGLAGALAELKEFIDVR